MYIFRTIAGVMLFYYIVTLVLKNHIIKFSLGGYIMHVIFRTKFFYELMLHI